MNGRIIAVMEPETSFKKGSRKRAPAGGTETAINSKLANKTKQLRAVNDSKKYAEEALGNNEKGHKTRSILRSNKAEQKFPSPQIKDEIQVVKKGVKHKKEQNCGEDQTRTKTRKIQSPGNAQTERKPVATEIKAIPVERKPISTERKPIATERKPVPTERKPVPTERKPVPTEIKPTPVERKPIPNEKKPVAVKRKPLPTERKPTEQPVTAVAGSRSKVKQKANLLSPTDSPVENRKLGHKPKKGQVKSGETSQKAPLQGSVSATPHKSSTKPKVVGTTTGTVDSNKRKIISKQKENEGISKNVESNTVTLTEIDTGDPMAVLMMMEGRGGNLTASQLPPDKEQEFEQQGFTSSEEESEGMSDWEDVYDHQVSDRSQLPAGPVEITLELPDILKRKKRQKQDFDWKAHLLRRVKRFKKQVAVDMHKVHLLCLLALGLRQNDVLTDHTVKAVLLSLLPSAYLTNKKLQVQTQVENLLLWHKRKFPQESITYCSNTRLVTSSVLIDAVSQEDITDARVWILLFVCLLRTVGLSVRLVMSFQPMRFKAHQGWDEKKGRKKQHRASTDQIAGDASKKKLEQSRSTASTSKTKPGRSTSSAKSHKPQTTSGKAANRRLSQRESSKQAALKNKNVLAGDSDADDENYISEDEAADSVDSDSDFSERGLHKMKEKKKPAAGHDDGDNSSSESDFTESSLSSPVNILKELKISSNRKILSPSTSDDEAAGGKRHGPVGHDIWLEVYFPESGKWLCFNCFKSQFGKPYTLGNSATQPLMYILGFKNDNSVKDVTARYSRQWLSHTRKNRIDQEWWTQTLLLFDNTSYKEKLLEDDEIKSQLLVQPMPTSIAEFKSHPLYALRRHLLKFEAIYPESAVPLGYVRKEPVYARECVHVLHSRDNWLKEGRLVRLNELPYKMVKSRPKWNKPKENPDALDLQLFGEWQTEKYMPPPAVNGKVPRNEYGNVELFKPWMLPLGTVQVRGQGLQRVAKKLNIDVAPAMIGWDSHSGHSHPVMDGWVVCEEFADTLMAAWLEDQEIQRQREQERKDKQVYDNWRRLIRGLLIRERLKTKFLQEAAPVEKVENQETFSDAEEACDVQHSWPRNRQDEVMKHKVKAFEAEIEREKKLLMKDLCNDRKILNKKVQNNKKMHVGSGAEKAPAKKVEVLKTKCKRKVAQVDDSGSSSSSDDDIVNPKLLPRKSNTAINNVEEEDPDFIVSERKVNSSWNSRNVKDKTVAVVASDDGRVEDRMGESNRRTSLARQVKKKVKLVDVSSDESDSDGSQDEQLCPSVGDPAVQDEGSSSPGSEPAQVTSSKTRRATTKPTRKRLKPKT